MKKAVLLLVFIASGSVYGQKIDNAPVKSLLLPDDIALPLKVDFSYYSKNYDKVFGEFNFTGDANNFGARNVYVGYNNTFYYQGNSTYITELPSNWPTYNFAGYQDVIGGIKNLASLFTSEKDYSIHK